MGNLTDKISKILSSINLVKVDVKVENLYIGGKQIKTDKYIENSGNFSITSREEDKSLQKKIDLKQFENSDGFTNIDILKEEFVTTKLFFSKGTIMKKYKQFLLQKDLSAVLMAYTVCSLEDTADEGARELKTNYLKLYKEKGSVIYNYVRSGLFETEILKKLNEIQRGTQDKLDVSKQFSEYFNSLIDFHPNNIYVSITWSLDELLREFVLRLNIFLKNQELERTIKVFSRSSNIKKVDKLKEMEQIQRLFEITEEPYKFGKEKAKTTFFKLKKIINH